jgi:hypothetical protein
MHSGLQRIRPIRYGMICGSAYTVGITQNSYYTHKSIRELAACFDMQSNENIYFENQFGINIVLINIPFHLVTKQNADNVCQSS